MQKDKRLAATSVSRVRTIGILAVPIVVCVIAVQLYSLIGGIYSDYQLQRMIQTAYGRQRPGGGRLFGAPYHPPNDGENNERDLGKAQVLLLGRPPSDKRQRIQGLLYLAAGDWAAFSESVNHLSESDKHLPATLNNLGVSFLALADTDPTFLLMRLQNFRRRRESRRTRSSRVLISLLPIDDFGFRVRLLKRCARMHQ